MESTLKRWKLLGRQCESAFRSRQKVLAQFLKIEVNLVASNDVDSLVTALNINQSRGVANIY